MECEKCKSKKLKIIGFESPTINQKELIIFKVRCLGCNYEFKQDMTEKNYFINGIENKIIIFKNRQ